MIHEPLPLEQAAPLPEDAAKPITQTIAHIDTAPADEAEDEARRREAYDGIYEWRGQQLMPFTPSKKALWDRLRAADVPLPVEAEYSRLEAHVSAAAKLLYLLTHEAETYAHLRTKPEAFIAEIERWQDDHIGHDESPEAVSLALRIHNDSLRPMAVPKPSGGSRAGN